MLAGLFNLKGLLLVGGFALAAGGFAGWMARDAFCDAAHAKAELAMAKQTIAFMAERIRVAETVAEEHAKRVEADAKADLENEEKVSDIPKNTSACLNIDVARRLRGIK